MRILTNPRILNEEYYGANNQLILAEKAIQKLKDKINAKGTAVDIEATEEYAILKSALCSVFGLSDMLLNAGVYYDFGIYTIPMYRSPAFMFTNMGDSKFVSKNKYGICFTKEADIVIYLCIDFAVLDEKGCNLSAKELLAVILHEIGHNFFSTDRKTTLILMFEYVRNVLTSFIMNMEHPEVYPQLLGQAMLPLFLSKTTYKWAAKIENWWLRLTKDSSIRKFFVGLQQAILFAKTEFFGTIGVINCLFNLPLVYLITIPRMVILSLFNLISFGWVDTLYVGYDNEKFSDNFATTYGYGPELSSGLIKLDDYMSKGATKTLKSFVESDESGATQFVINLYALPYAVLSHALLDCHPTTEQRVLNQTKLLKTELKKKNLSPATKKKILADIERMETIENTYFNVSNKDNLFQRWRKESSKNRVPYGGDIREEIRGEAQVDTAKEWKQFERANLNSKVNPQ